jgi:hypothetical protein
MQRLRWTLVFTPSILEHLAEREIDADDVADAVFGRYVWHGSDVAAGENAPGGSLWLRQRGVNL